MHIISARIMKAHPVANNHSDIAFDPTDQDLSKDVRDILASHSPNKSELIKKVLTQKHGIRWHEEVDMIDVFAEAAYSLLEERSQTTHDFYQKEKEYIRILEQVLLSKYPKEEVHAFCSTVRPKKYDAISFEQGRICYNFKGRGTSIADGLAGDIRTRKEHKEITAPLLGSEEHRFIENDAFLAEILVDQKTTIFHHGVSRITSGTLFGKIIIPSIKNDPDTRYFDHLGNIIDEADYSRPKDQ